MGLMDGCEVAYFFREPGADFCRNQLNEFHRLAEATVRCVDMSSIPPYPSDSRLYLRGTAERGDLKEQWLSALYRISWHLSGPILRAEPSIHDRWVGSEMSFARHLLDECTDGIRWTVCVPLSPDIFLASALAVDFLRARSGGDRLFVDDIDSFQKVRDVTPQMVADVLPNGFLNCSEEQVQVALEQILSVPFHKKDWGGEINDLYTSNVMVRGRRRDTAFLLKGPGIGQKEMHIADCGKRGDQLVRLFDTPAQLYVVQYVGPIADLLIKDVKGKAAGKKVQFVIMDGQDTARVLRAYGRLCVRPRIGQRGRKSEVQILTPQPEN